MTSPHRRTANGRPRASTNMHRAALRVPSAKRIKYRASCVGPVIYDMRRSRGVSDEELASRIGVSVWTLRGWERGRAVPPLFRLVAIAAALACRVADLVAECDP